MPELVKYNGEIFNLAYLVNARFEDEGGHQTLTMDFASPEFSVLIQPLSSCYRKVLFEQEAKDIWKHLVTRAAQVRATKP